ncbi:interleukin-27 subunit beta [Maylandia zebra]|uniref:Epstein-Barr virus induced 3 n=2 Tax=Haplochromini TaxID=319058 RepID=A0A3P9ASY5_9CICH|nr:interleukin-27 subunit beta [Maylandia zebra]XP_026008711.1 interleukin-27 subunit beta [Astatotilapia calliptera]XP_039898632.1 interleukin-27 subunit beta [Simochromis diagramma]
MRAAVFGGGYVTVILLISIVESQALDLLRGAGTSQNPLSAPKVHCWCSSYPNATLCTWPKPPHFPTTHYIATYSERHNQASTKECHLLPPGSSSSEKFWICQLPNLKLLTDYIINITAVHSGRSSSHLTSFMLEDIVKPDPPVDVRVSPTNNRKLLVEWSPPPTWTNLAIFPLKYQIIYQWENKGIRRSVNLGPYENTTVELKALTPGRPYLFQVCARELLGLGKCSDWSMPVKITIPRKRL